MHAAHGISWIQYGRGPHVERSLWFRSKWGMSLLGSGYCVVFHYAHWVEGLLREEVIEGHNVISCFLSQWREPLLAFSRRNDSSFLSHYNASRANLGVPLENVPVWKFDEVRVGL